MKVSNKPVSIAIIGLGNIGKAVAGNLVKGGYQVTVASRDIKKSTTYAHELGNLASSAEIQEAIENADVVIPTIHFNDLIDFLQTYAEALEDKVVFDVSNPIAPDGKGGFKKIIEAHESAGEIIQSYLPKNAKLVKTFGTLGAETLTKEAFAVPQPKVMFYASDSTNMIDLVEDIIQHSGYDPIFIGGMAHASRIEVFGDLHELGGLGKTITREQVNLSL